MLQYDSFMEEILFTKMHGAGNDYLYVNCMDSVPSDIPQLAMDMSDRHKGLELMD